MNITTEKRDAVVAAQRRMMEGFARSQPKSAHPPTPPPPPPPKEEEEEEDGTTKKKKKKRSAAGADETADKKPRIDDGQLSPVNAHAPLATRTTVSLADLSVAGKNAAIAAACVPLFMAASEKGVFLNPPVGDKPVPYARALVLLNNAVAFVGGTHASANLTDALLRDTLRDASKDGLFPWVTRCTRVPQFIAGFVPVPPCAVFNTALLPTQSPIRTLAIAEVKALLAHMVPVAPNEKKDEGEWGSSSSAAAAAVVGAGGTGVGAHSAECAKSAILASVLSLAFCTHPGPLVFIVHPTTGQWLRRALGVPTFYANSTSQNAAKLAKEELAPALWTAVETGDAPPQKLEQIAAASGVSVFCTASMPVHGSLKHPMIIVPAIECPPSAGVALRSFAHSVITETRATGGLTIKNEATPLEANVTELINACLAKCELPLLYQCTWVPQKEKGKGGKDKVVVGDE